MLWSEPLLVIEQDQLELIRYTFSLTKWYHLACIMLRGTYVLLRSNQTIIFHWHDHPAEKSLMKSLLFSIKIQIHLEVW